MRGYFSLIGGGNTVPNSVARYGKILLFDVFLLNFLVFEMLSLLTLLSVLLVETERSLLVIIGVDHHSLDLGN